MRPAAWDSLTWPKLGGVVLMTIGMIIACYTEPLFNVKGIALMFVGEAAEAGPKAHMTPQSAQQNHFICPTRYRKDAPKFS